MRNTICALLLLVLFAIGLVAQDSKSYDIKHYNILLDPDFATGRLHERATIDIDDPGLSNKFTFNLSERFSNVSVSANGVPAALAKNGDEVTVTPAKAAKQVRLVFELEGIPGRSVDEQRDVIEPESLFLLWSDEWYPADFDDWATVETTLVIPKRFQAIAPGKLVRTTAEGENIRYTFATSQPTVSYSVFADSRWIRTERDVNGFHIQTLLYPGSDEFRDQIFATSADVLKTFSGWFNGYPFDQFSFVTMSGTYARRAFPGWVAYSPRYLRQEMKRTGHDVHETSLLWWCYVTHGSGPGSFQWTEGFGDYAEVMYDEARYRPIPRIFETFRESYLKVAGEKDMPYTALRGNTPQELVHGKYPWLMQMIRRQYGDQAFLRAMNLLFTRYRFRTFTMDEFVSTMEEGTGQSLAWWRKNWLDRGGVPVISIASKIATAAPYRVECQIEYVRDVYDLPIEIGIETPTGVLVETVRMDKKQATFTFESAEKPERVLLDPNGKLFIIPVDKN
jgi:hypothetical protein